MQIIEVVSFWVKVCETEADLLLTTKGVGFIENPSPSTSFGAKAMILRTSHASPTLDKAWLRGMPFVSPIWLTPESEWRTPVVCVHLSDYCSL